MLSFTYDFSGMVYSLEFSPSSEEGGGGGGGGGIRDGPWRPALTLKVPFQ